MRNGCNLKFETSVRPDTLLSSFLNFCVRRRCGRHGGALVDDTVSPEPVAAAAATKIVFETLTLRLLYA